MVSLNSHGEVIDVNEADQFQPAKSEFECGFFASAIARSMAPVGVPPTLSVAQIIKDAEGWYAQYDGTDAITNTNGMTTAQLYNLLQEIGLHYQTTATDANTVKDWLHAGYPVIIAITEASVHDLALGDTNPYPWHPAGTHIILVTGVAHDGNLLVRDSANCTDLNNPNSLRPGPRTYDVAKLQIVSATVVVPSWMPRPTSDKPPVVATTPIHTSGVPTGWLDASEVLTSPNGVPVLHGFREYILSHHWEPSNIPLAPEFGLDSLELTNPALGKGTAQYFEEGVLEWTEARGTFAMWVGRELKATREKLYAYYTAIKLRDERIAQIEAELQKYVNWVQAQRGA